MVEGHRGESLRGCRVDDLGNDVGPDEVTSGKPECLAGAVMWAGSAMVVSGPLHTVMCLKQSGSGGPLYPFTMENVILYAWYGELWFLIKLAFSAWPLVCGWNTKDSLADAPMEAQNHFSG